MKRIYANNLAYGSQKQCMGKVSWASIGQLILLILILYSRDRKGLTFEMLVCFKSLFTALLENLALKLYEWT